MSIPTDVDLDLEPDDALAAAMALRRVAERGLMHGDATERTLSADLLAFLDGDTDEPLEAVIGISGPGWCGARRRLRQERRDATLRALWRDTCPDLSPTAAARLLAARWRRYAASAWPRHRDAGIAPTGDPEQTFHDLMQRSHALLGAERLRKILGRDGEGYRDRDGGRDGDRDHDGDRGRDGDGGHDRDGGRLRPVEATTPIDDL